MISAVLTTTGLCATAAVCISTVEAIARTTATMPLAMAKAAPFVIVAQVALYYIFNGASSMMGAWLTFTIFMTLVRVGNSMFFLREGLDLTWVGLSVTLMFIAAIAMKQSHIQ